MSGQSLGLIETVGLTVAVEAADAAMKSANVGLVGYELTKGGGLVTVKLSGEVGAINAAVAAGVAAAKRVGEVYAWKVIARTASGIDSLITSRETCGVIPPAPATQDTPSVEEHQETVIAVVTLETQPSLSRCELMSDDATGATPTVPERDNLNEQADEPEVVVEAVTANGEAQEKKPLRPRGKSTRK